MRRYNKSKPSVILGHCARALRARAIVVYTDDGRRFVYGETPGERERVDARYPAPEPELE